MKFQVFILLVAVALALAKKDKDKDNKDKPKENEKPIENKVIEDDPLVNMYDSPIDDSVGKLSVMDWESSYDTSPIEILRKLRIGGLPYMYNRGLYDGYYQYPQNPYRGIYRPSQLYKPPLFFRPIYKNFGYYPLI